MRLNFLHFVSLCIGLRFTYFSSRRVGSSELFGNGGTGGRAYSVGFAGAPRIRIAMGSAADMGYFEDSFGRTFWWRKQAAH